MAGPRLITAQELADILKLSVETIWRYTRESRIPYIQLSNGQYRYDPEKVLDVYKRQLYDHPYLQYNDDPVYYGQESVACCQVVAEVGYHAPGGHEYHEYHGNHRVEGGLLSLIHI